MELHSTPSPRPTIRTVPAREGKHGLVLATKIVTPRCPGLIERPRLLAMASQLSDKRLAVIKAPAGFGKTSLAVSWSAAASPDGNAVAWLTIDPDDDEPRAFFFYVTQAMQRACTGGWCSRA